MYVHSFIFIEVTIADIDQKFFRFAIYYCSFVCEFFWANLRELGGHFSRNLSIRYGMTHLKYRLTWYAHIIEKFIIFKSKHTSLLDETSFVDVIICFTFYFCRETHIQTLITQRLLD